MQKVNRYSYSFECPECVMFVHKLICIFENILAEFPQKSLFFVVGFQREA